MLPFVQRARLSYSDRARLFLGSGLVRSVFLLAARGKATPLAHHCRTSIYKQGKCSNIPVHSPSIQLHDKTPQNPMLMIQALYGQFTMLTLPTDHSSDNPPTQNP